MPESPQSSKSSRNAELSSLFTFCLTNVSTVTGIRGDGRGRATQSCRRFWIRLGSSRVNSVNSHRGRGGRGRQRRTVVTFGLASGERKGEMREQKREMRGEKRGGIVVPLSIL